MSAEAKPSIEQMCAEARKRLAEFINRSVGQHLRAMRSSKRGES